MRHTLSISQWANIKKRTCNILLLLTLGCLLPTLSRAQITGPSSVCVGSGATLTETTTGTWSSSAPAVATIGSSTGIVAGITPGATTISFTNGTITHSITVTVNPLPSVYTVSGGGSICAGAPGLHILLSGSTVGTNYQLYNGPSAIGSSIAGTASSLDFGLETAAGTYTVIATNPVTLCSATMTGSPAMVVNPDPSITGPSALCAGATIPLSASIPAGTWASSAPATATIGSTGIVTGIALGVTTITYTLPTTCSATASVTVSAPPCTLPVAPTLCAAYTFNYTNCNPGGTWTSSAPSVATIGSLSGIATGVSAGTATITYSLGAGCTVAAPLSVITSPAAITGPSAACVGSGIALSDVTSSGAWSSSAPAIGSVSTSGIVAGISAGVTTISYTIGSCAAIRSISVNAVPPAIGGPSSICVAAPALMTNASTGGTWAVTPGAYASINPFTGSITGAAPGTATVYYSLGGCFVTKPVTVNATAPITGATGLCSGITTSLSNAVSGGTWSSGNTAVATINPGTGLLTTAVPGTSVISYSLPTGCTVIKTVTVSAFPGPISGPASICNGTCATYTGSLSGGTWSLSSGIASLGSASGTLCGLAPGTATISFTLGGGCIATAPVTVSIAPAPISGPSTVCAGADITLTNTLPGGNWSSGDLSIATIGLSTGIVHGIVSGTDIITYTYSTGCTAIFPVNVASFSAITGPSSVCIGQIIPLTNSVFGGTWTSSAPAIATVSGGVVTGISAGSATISYLTPAGCLPTATITVNALPLPISGPHALCEGFIIILSDPSSGGTWSHANPSVTNLSGAGLVIGLSAGVDTITYAYSGGCSTAFTVTVNPLPAAITGPPVVCAGATIALSNTSLGGAWLSSLPAIATIGSSSGIVTGIAAGTATISYTLPTGCQVIGTVSVMPLPAAITGVAAICIGATTSLTDLSPGGSWASANPAIATIGISTGLVTSVAPGAAVITYSTGTSCDATFTITVNPLPASISGSTLICQGASTTLTDPTPGGTWSTANPAIVSIGISSGLVTGLSAGIAAIDYTAPTGCHAFVSIAVNPLPAPIVGYPAACIGATSTYFDATPGGSWSSSNPAIAPVSSSGVISGLFTGTAIITYLAPSGCIATLPITINPPPLPIAGSAVICAGTTTFFTDIIPGGVWASSDASVAAVGSSSGFITGIASGTVTIAYTLGAGCLVTKSLTVNPSPLPVTGPSGLCLGDTASLTDATPGGVWSTSDASIITIGSTTGLVSTVSLGIATLRYTLGCTALHTMTVNPMPSLITGFTNACIGSSFFLHDSVVGGTWSSSAPGIATIGSSTALLSGITPGTTTISYTLPGGCFTSTLVTISAPPSLFAITGGGNYCSGAPGVHIGLSGSEAGVSYVLYHGTTASGTITGTGFPIDFGLQTLIGAYTVVASNMLSACTATMPGSATISITPSVVPAISIAASPGDTVCAGIAVSFTTTTVNAGITPAYRWLVNGIMVSAATSYSYIPVAGDIVTVQLASSITCALPDTVADADSMTVNPSAAPSVTLTASPNDTVCLGTLVTITPIPLYGGIAPSYSWIKNGVLVSSSPLYSLLAADSDVIYCILQSNYPCRTSNTDTSDALVLSVETPVVPSITITAYPSTIINPGDTLILTATVVNGGFSPSYQWYFNSVLIPGATSDTYTIDSFTDVQLDSFACFVTSSGPCHISAEQLTYISVVPVSIRQLSGLYSDLKILPNPNQGDFTLKGIVGNTNDQLQLEITNMLGQVVYKNNLIVNNGKVNQHIGLSALTNGFYVLSISTKDGRSTLHMVIEK
jgi:uncharacterized protein YjdB